MFVFLSKLLPLFVYPLGLTCLLLVMALLINRQSRWLKVSVGTALALLCLGGNGYITTSLVRSLEWQYLPPQTFPKVEIIVVLGGGIDAAQYPREIVEVGGAVDRLFYASWLYHQGVAPRLLLTGRYAPWLEKEDYSLAEDMADILEMLGVPEDALTLEKEALNTYENAVYSKAILEKEGINRIVLVTSAQHMPRAVRIFEKLGMEVIPAPTDYRVTQDDWERLWKPGSLAQILDWLPNAANLSTTTSALKEYLGIIIYRLRGWL